MDGRESEPAARKAWLGLLAKAPHARLLELTGTIDRSEPIQWLRPPEIGAVMVRGRIGGSGGPFNLGEMTVTRASLRLACGAVGHGYVQGRSRPAAEAAALVDALMQTATAGTVRSAVLEPLEREMTARSETRAAKAAATRVEFFTMARGED